MFLFEFLLDWHGKNKFDKTEFENAYKFDALDLRPNAHVLCYELPNTILN
jgi:hypothetical protein